MLSSDERRSRLENLLSRVQKNRNRPRVILETKPEPEALEEPAPDTETTAEDVRETAESIVEVEATADATVEETALETAEESAEEIEQPTAETKSDISPEEQFFGEDSGALLASIEPSPVGKEPLAAVSTSEELVVKESSAVQLSREAVEDLDEPEALELEDITEDEAPEDEDAFSDDEELAEVEELSDDEELEEVEALSDDEEIAEIEAPKGEVVRDDAEEKRVFKETVTASSDVAAFRSELKTKEWTLAAVFERAFRLGESK